MAKTNSESSSEQNLMIDDTAIELEPSQRDIDCTCVSNSKRSTFVKRLLNSDGRRFRKFVHSTTTHGVIHIFSGKSKIRRFLWLVLVLTSAAACLFDIIKSIGRLAQGNAETAISVVEPDSVDFPAITLCNLNLVKINSELGMFINQTPTFMHIHDTSQNCNERVENFPDLLSESYPDLLWNGRHTAETTIVRCKFKGQECSHTDFTPILMPSGGVCYTFNGESGPSVRKTEGTGTRFALSLIINVQQREYIATLNQDVGVKIAIHPQSELPQPDELGIAIPPGKNAFISIRRLNITNVSSRKKCRDVQDTKSFKFLQNTYRYSESACEVDCLMSNIAQKCKCLGPFSPPGVSSGPFNFHTDLQNCTVRDVCCLQTQNARPSTSACDCRVACETTLYITETSYSAFPAKYAIDTLFDELENSTIINMNINDLDRENFLRENLLGINVYFETLTVEEQTIHDSYDFITMLSDIGGQLALFLGASVISVLEFLAWVFDEVKDRCLGISERKIMRKIKPAVMVNLKKLKRHKEGVVIQEVCRCTCNEGDSGISVELQGIDYTKL